MATTLLSADSTTSAFPSLSSSGTGSLTKTEHVNSPGVLVGSSPAVLPTPHDLYPVKQQDEGVAVKTTENSDEILKPCSENNALALQQSLDQSLSGQQPQLSQYLGDASLPHASHETWASTMRSQEAAASSVATGSIMASRPIASLCGVCQQPILDRYLLTVLGVAYHESCLRCSNCQVPLIEVSNKCYRNRAGANLCEKDYILLKQSQQSYMSRNSPMNTCCGCFHTLLPSDWVTTIHDKRYHADCFVCCVCRQRLVKGSNFVLVNNQIWCENDYHNGYSAFTTPLEPHHLHHHPEIINNPSLAIAMGHQQQPLY